MSDLSPSLSLSAAASRYRTQPSQTETGMPAGVPYIIGNEAAERFSFYGMKSILALFMTQFLLVQGSATGHLTDNQAGEYTHYFVAGVYYLPIAGALLADGVLGKYRTILWLSLVYCLGHFALACNDKPLGLIVGLTLICLGAGGIKPCVSANVGDQFGASNKNLLPKVFSWFYFSINAGSFISTILCPWLLHKPGYGPAWAFGIPGVAMVIATISFWLGRRKFVHVPPAGLGFVREAISPEGRGVLLRLLSIYVFIIIFWALWDQSSGVEWTLQATKMDLHLFGYEIDPGQITTVNAILILVYIPLVTYVLYPAISRFFPLTPLRKIGIGMFLTGISFAPIVYAQRLIEQGEHPTIWWQILAYAILTLAEAMVSITGLEFSYTQSPNTMKSAVMALWLLTVATANLLVAWFHAWNELPAGKTKVTDLQFDQGCMWTMLATACAFVVAAMFYRGKTYLQGEEVKAEADIGVATANMPA